MVSTYRILAFTIAALVGVQAASHAWSSAGLGLFVRNGGVVDAAMMENSGGPLPFPEVLGILVHGMNGVIVIPIVAISLLVVSFFSRVRGAIRWASLVLAVVAVQVTLGFSGHALPLLGLLHGANALILFGVAVGAARIVRRPTGAVAGAEPSSQDLSTV